MLIQMNFEQEIKNIRLAQVLTQQLEYDENEERKRRVKKNIVSRKLFSSRLLFFAEKHKIETKAWLENVDNGKTYSIGSYRKTHISHMIYMFKRSDSYLFLNI